MADRVFHVKPAAVLCGVCQVPSDKSIAQRAFLLAMVAKGRSFIQLPGQVEGLCDDIKSTVKVCRALGACIEPAVDGLMVVGTGGALTIPVQPLDCGESATLMRLLIGLLAGMGVSVAITGAPGLMRRPMQRILKPLNDYGGKVSHPHADLIQIDPGSFRAIDYQLTIGSAQIKSSLLLAGLHASSQTVVVDPWDTRDHTERLLRAMGCDVSVHGDATTLTPKPLQSLICSVPGDFSAAAFLLVAACLIPGAKIELPHVGCNPTRTELIHVLGRMGAFVTIKPDQSGQAEPTATMMASYHPMHAIEVDAKSVSKMIDELPILAVAMACANGRSVIRGAGELRHKESDRIAAIAVGLKQMGVAIEAYEDGWVIEGGSIRGGEVDAGGDHRMAMAFAVAGLVSRDGVSIRGGGCVRKSYRHFYDDLKALCVEKIVAPLYHA